MSRTMLASFVKFHEEAAIIGRLLGGYTTLELDLMNCVQIVRDDFDAIFKAMFRVRGETNRIDVADALGRHYYHDHGIGQEFEIAIGVIRSCLRIRNQYAHCVWYDDNSSKLAFVDLEQIAKTNAKLQDLTSLTIFHVDVPLLQSQEEYFAYADDLLRWTNFEGRLRAGTASSNPTQKPKQLMPPKLNIP